MTDSAEKLYERILILRCQAGDGAALAELAERYHLRLRYYLRKMLGDAHRAEDALQDVWLDVLRALPRLKDAGAFAAWLFRIARDRAYRSVRSNRRPAGRLEGLDPEVPDADEGFSPEDAAAIHAALDRLTPEHREALILRFVEEMNYEQIAAVTGVSVGTVRSRLHYAKRALRHLLEGTGEHEGERIGRGAAGL